MLVSGVDESSVPADRADEVSLVLARLKATAVAERLRADSGQEPTSPGGADAETEAGTLVLGCDSVLDFDGEVLGKPEDAQEASRRWVRMRGRSGVLHTGHCLILLGPDGDERRAEAVAATTVHFAAISDEEIAAYVATGEPLRVAGAFTIDGLGGPFVERLEGDHGTVVGLSMPLLRRLLGELGLRISDLWAGSVVPAPAHT